MEIKKTINKDELYVEVSGRLDTNTSPELEASIREDIDNVNSLVIDLKELEYILSAGLRTILTFQKILMARGGKLVIKNVNDSVMEVFDMTGFSSFLTIEE